MSVMRGIAFRRPIGLARLPDDVMIGDPSGFDVRAVEKATSQPLAAFADNSAHVAFSSSWRVGGMPNKSEQVSGSDYQRARARGSRIAGAATGARTDTAWSRPAIGDGEVDKLARARTPSAAATAATRAALFRRMRCNISTVSIHEGVEHTHQYARAHIPAVMARTAQQQGK